MPTSDTIATVSAAESASVLVHGSKFIGHIAPAATEDDALATLNTRRRKYADATHNCWAYRVGLPGELIERSSDDGEPSGTAGRPMLDTLRRDDLQNVVCVVTRYFGGTKLGTGGLVRAYSDAAAAAIAAAAIIQRRIMRVVAIDFDHEQTGVLYRALEEFGLHLVPGAYDERGHGIIHVPRSRVEPLAKRLRELTHSGIDLTAGETIIE
ncbi:MAG: YigZ family protein [Candidatus Zixiibacteriota bacterium]